ncbi:MAG: replicative DNA helicase [Desulfobacteraceae bacterium]|nr:replicative DNA helicase [Desulfobacteraceae bacterium]
MESAVQNNTKDHSLQKLPPQSIEAEESILSAILLDNSTLLDILEILNPADFYRTSHQKIFSAIGELFTRAEPVDLVTLTNFLRDKNQLEEIGGASYLARLVDTVPSAVSVKHYALIVRDKSSLRRMISRANEITQQCYEKSGDVDNVLDFAESAIFEISEDKHRAAFHPLNKIVDANITTLEERQQNRALVTGVPTGYTRLDHMTSGLQPSDLVIIAARPSMGKTAFALNMARNAAVDANIPVAIFSLEMSKEQLSMRLLGSEARVDSQRLRGGFLNREDWNRITDAASVLSEAPIFIDDSPDISATSIRTKSRRLKMDKGLGMVIVDYLQLMKGKSSTERRDLEISEISRSLKLLAKEINVPVIALSQLNRKLEERSDKRPLLSDLRESGALEQDADVVAFIYRDEVYNKDGANPNKGTAEIIVSKQRNGPVGTVNLTFLNSHTRFENSA